MLTVFPAAAAADVQTIDFETGALDSPLGGQGDIAFLLGQGLRPYRADVGIRAHSGTSVGDVGRCAEEVEAIGGNAGSCEFFQARTTAFLFRTARSVTVFAGRFGPVGPLDPPELATLTAFNAVGNQVASTGPAPIGTDGFNTRLSLSRGAGDIAGFTVRATGGPLGENEFAGDLGIDDLSVSFADGGAPDFSVSTTNQIVPLVQGQSVDIPVQITRLNGSNGPIRISATDLPKGVSADPVTVPGTQSTAEVTLTADFSAEDTNLAPLGATIVADPLGEANVAPGPRTAAFRMRLASAYQLDLEGITDRGGSTETPVLVPVPDCAPRDVALKIPRDIAFEKKITLSIREDTNEVTGLPRGISAEILPSAVVSPGGGLVAERTLRFSADPAAYSDLAPLVLEARTGPGDPPHTIPILLAHASSRAQIDTSRPGSTLGRTPRLGQPGTRIRVTGNGFCPGTTVRVGNEFARAPVTLVDPTTIEFNVPREATSGEVDVVVPGIGRYRASGELTIDSFRNVEGFPFNNFPVKSLSLGEFVEAFGGDDVFLTVNPCWPFGSCRVPTGIVDPLAAIKWKVVDDLLSGGESGHCFGISLAVQQRRKRYPAFERMSPSGPGETVESMLDVEHARQAADAFIAARADRERSLAGQLNLIEREFGQGRKVIVVFSVRNGDRIAPRAHSLLAYDMTQTAAGADISVYDSNKEFVEEEEVNHRTHRDRIGTIHIDRVAKTWSYLMASDEVWTGGDGGSLWAVPAEALPENPSLPGVSTLTEGLGRFLFESPDGSAIPTKKSAEAEFLPAIDGTGPTTAGTWVSRDGGLEAGVTGVKRGRYSQAYVAPGFVAALTDVPTEEGVRDTILGAGDSLRFESGEARPLSIQLARRSGEAVTSAATVRTGASAGGADSAGLTADGALTYAHDGDPTTVDFTLTTVRRNGGPASFASGPISVRRGDRLRAEPLDRELRRVRLTVRDARGRRTSRVLENRSRPLVRLQLGAARVVEHRLTMPVRFSGRRSRAILGASLRLMRGGRQVARQALALKGAGGAGQIAWSLPGSVRDGRYRLVVDARAITSAGRGSTEAGSATAHRVATVQVGA